MTKKAVVLSVIAASAVAIYIFLYNKNNDKPVSINTTGTVEALEFSISPKISGKLTMVKYREGERVKSGELVAELQSTDLEAAYRQAVSALAAERSNAASGIDTVANARAQVAVARADVESQKAAVTRAQAQLAQSGKDLARSKELFDRGIVAKADLDLAETARDTRAAELESAKAAVILSQARVDAAVAALRKAQGDVKTLNAQVSASAQNVELQNARLADTKIYSPVDGVVEYRSLEEGEIVSPGTSIMTLIDPKSIWVRFDLEQRYVNIVKNGQKAYIRLEGVPDRVINGTIYDIGREGEFATERDVTRGRQDIKTFRTRIKVDDPEGMLKPGMSVLVEIPER
jgi:HlyD family secretion protein